jgi:hypothetical protein
MREHARVPHHLTHQLPSRPLPTQRPSAEPMDTGGDERGVQAVGGGGHRVQALSDRDQSDERGEQAVGLQPVPALSDRHHRQREKQRDLIFVLSRHFDDLASSNSTNTTSFHDHVNEGRDSFSWMPRAGSRYSRWERHTSAYGHSLLSSHDLPPSLPLFLALFLSLCLSVSLCIYILYPLLPTVLSRSLSLHVCIHTYIDI